MGLTTHDQVSRAFGDRWDKAEKIRGAKGGTCMNSLVVFSDASLRGPLYLSRGTSVDLPTGR